MLRLVDELQAKGVEIISLREKLDTTTPQGRFILTVFAGLAELERETITERQREGIAIAKVAGKYKRLHHAHSQAFFSALDGQYSFHCIYQ